MHQEAPGENPRAEKCLQDKDIIIALKRSLQISIINDPIAPKKRKQVKAQQKQQENSLLVSQIMTSFPYLLEAILENLLKSHGCVNIVPT